ncbi:hypothetical protein [Sphingopyxis sp. H050]|jgi:hypothetical protein|uniref:hypothetical protein n=1 Tax=Sphingopyxis sp. H050 TaxID=1759072 RepID=UPI000A82AB9E|nr:hypothetical protein [Sphingopyxis sp. H050]
MKNWHQTLAANVGLRAGGMLLLGFGWAVAMRLHHMALGAPVREAAPLTLALSAATFLCGSAGSALLLIGPGLWETVEVSERWRRLPMPVPESSSQLHR